MTIMAQGQENGFVEHPIARTTLLHQVLQEQLCAHQLEYQKHTAQVARLELEIETLKLENPRSRMNGNHYVVLLVDGDNLIFDLNLLSLGGAGGIAAAERLSLAIDKHLRATLPDPDLDLKIVVRVYANASKLFQKPNVAAAIDSVAVLEDFIRGFNSHKLYFDFVDIGIGQVDANTKIEALFDHHLENPHCRQVILGVNSLRGDLNKLKSIADHNQLPSICLVKRASRQTKPAQLGFTIPLVNLDTIFNNKIVVTYEETHQTLDVKPDVSNHSAQISSSNGKSPSFYSAQTHYSPSPESTALTESIKAKQLTWARVAKAPPPRPPPAPRREIPSLPAPRSSKLAAQLAAQPTTLTACTSIPRNAYGQRIDPFYPTPEEDWRRIQELRLCNSWFLRQNCKYGDKCNHKHTLSREESGQPNGRLYEHDREVLAQVTRYVPCRYGTACDDVSCMFGHRCPVQENARLAGGNVRLAGRNVTARVCKFRGDCRFKDEMHVVDLRVVNEVKSGRK